MEIIKIENGIKMTSLELAELTGKNHADVLRDIRDEIEKLGEKGLSIFAESSYINSQNKKQPMFEFSKKGAMQIALRYSAEIRFKIIEKLEEREKFLMHNINKYESIIKPLENIELNGNVDNLVYSKNGTPITTSRIIASKFNKEHREILRAIDNKLQHKNETIVQFCTVNIKSVEYLSENGQQYREYELTEQGFNFIALSLTGENADLHKIKFIESYHKIRETLMNMFKAKLIEEVLPQDNRNRQYIYIIKNNDTNRIKIGVAQNVEKRLKQLQTGSDSELSIVYRSNLCSNAFDVERFMHTNFKDYHVRGEWFDLNETEIINELEKQNFVLKSEFIEKLNLKEISNNAII